MSIVNQMLRDLDARRGPASGNQLAALQGLGLIPAERHQLSNPGLFLAWGCASLFAVLAGYQAIDWWRGDDRLAEAKFAPVLQETTDLAVATNTEELSPIHPNQPVTSPLQPDTVNSGSETEIPLPSPTITAPLTTAVSLPVEPVQPVRQLTSQQKSDRFFSDAQAAINGQDYAEGEMLLRQALFEFPNHHSARAQLAALLAVRQNSDAAERLLAQGLQYNAREIELAKPYAQLLVAKGELQPALETLNAAITGEHIDPQAYALRAAVLQRLNRHADAARDYRQALTVHTQNAVWWAGLAIAQEHDSQFQQALTAYRQAARLPMEESLRNYVNQRIQLIQNTDGQ